MLSRVFSRQILMPLRLCAQRPVASSLLMNRFNSTSNNNKTFQNDSQRPASTQGTGNKNNLSKEQTLDSNDSIAKKEIDIDELLRSSIPDFAFEKANTDDILLDVEADPRLVAKRMRVNDHNAGRIVDLKFNNISQGLAMNRRLVKENKIRYLAKVQKRFIRPGKYKGQLRREWWRRHFKSGFRDMLSQVNDARRRGY